MPYRFATDANAVVDRAAICADLVSAVFASVNSLWKARSRA